jgi:hypothetical protein
MYMHTHFARLRRLSLPFLQQNVFNLEKMPVPRMAQFGQGSGAQYLDHTARPRDLTDRNAACSATSIFIYTFNSYSLIISFYATWWELLNASLNK